MISFLLFGTLLAIVSGEAPLLAPYAPAELPKIELPLAPYAPAVPLPAKVELPLAPYPPAKVELPSAPYPPAIPAAVYGVPKIELPAPKPILTSYGYELITPPKPILKVAPVPAPVYGLPNPVEIIKTEPVLKPYAAPVPAPVYGLPKIEIVKPIAPIKTSYSYELPLLPKILKTYPAPAPVYGVPKIDLPIFPAPVYGVPKIELPVVQQPIETTYKFDIPEVIKAPVEVLPVVKSAPYPAAVPLPKIPELPIVPHAEYGVPQF